MTSGSHRELAISARAWPFEEARKLVTRIEARRAAGRLVNEVLFETGYGPVGSAPYWDFRRSCAHELGPAGL